LKEKDCARLPTLILSSINERERGKKVERIIKSGRMNAHTERKKKSKIHSARVDPIRTFSPKYACV